VAIRERAVSENIKKEERFKNSNRKRRMISTPNKNTNKKKKKNPLSEASGSFGTPTLKFAVPDAAWRAEKKQVGKDITGRNAEMKPMGLQETTMERKGSSKL